MFHSIPSAENKPFYKEFYSLTIMQVDALATHTICQRNLGDLQIIFQLVITFSMCNTINMCFRFTKIIHKSGKKRLSSIKITREAFNIAI